MAKAKKDRPPQDAPGEQVHGERAGCQPARRPDEMGESRRRRRRRRALRQRRVDLRRPAHGRARETREQRRPRPRPARLRRPAPGLRLLDRLLAGLAAHAGQPRGRHGARRAGGPGVRHRAGGAAGPELARPRSQRQEPALRQGAAGHGGRSRGRGARGEGRDQFRRRRSELGPVVGDAGGQQRLLRRLPPQRLFAVLRGAGRRRHRHGARLRMDQRRPSRRPHGRRPRSAATPASSRFAGSTRARQRARGCRWSTIGASRAG